MLPGRVDRPPLVIPPVEAVVGLEVEGTHTPVLQGTPMVEGFTTLGLAAFHTQAPAEVSRLVRVSWKQILKIFQTNRERAELLAQAMPKVETPTHADSRRELSPPPLEETPLVLGVELRLEMPSVEQARTMVMEVTHIVVHLVVQGVVTLRTE